MATCSLVLLFRSSEFFLSALEYDHHWQMEAQSQNMTSAKTEFGALMRSFNQKIALLALLDYHLF